MAHGKKKNELVKIVKYIFNNEFFSLQNPLVLIVIVIILLALIKYFFG